MLTLISLRVKVPIKQINQSKIQTDLKQKFKKLNSNNKNDD